MMKKSILLLLLALFISSQFCRGQSLSSSELKTLTDQKFTEAISNLRQFLRLKNDGNYSAQIETNKRWCDSVFTSLNFKTQTLKTDGAPLLFAEKIYHKNRKSILFYLQIDGQPVDPSAWSQTDPFEPVLKAFKDGIWEETDWNLTEGGLKDEFRIFARSASDSKGPAMSFISALQILQSNALKPEFNIRVIMDFQEELGSPHLPKAVLEHKKLLDAEMLFIMDGTRHLSNLPTLTYGARGIATATLTVFGPTSALHSGQYGNYAPNPVFGAARLISSMKDEQGVVQIPGFYEGVVLTEQDKKMLSQIPEDMDSLNVRLGISAPEKVSATYQEALQYPSLNIRGINA
ncbi:MAG: M20/M25/M40 family metallo-hydrolase, partial [Maribacter sp.]